MVRKILSFLGRDVLSIHHAAYILAIATFTGQLLGLLRDRLLASQFGAGSTLDVYYSAFRVQDVIFTTIGSLLSVSVILPLLSEALQKEEGRIRKVLDSLFSITLLTVLLFGIVAFLIAPFLSTKLFPGIIGENHNTLVQLMRLLLLSPIFFSISGIYASVVQLYNRFYITSVAPILYNIGIICGVVFFFPHFGIFGIGLGVLLGAALHMAVHIPFVIYKNLAPRLTFSIDWALIAETIYLALTRGLALLSQQFVLIIMTGMATLIGTGAVTVMVFAQNLNGVPLGLIGMSYSIATFPVLSRVFAEGNKDLFRLHLESALRHIIFWSLPAAALFIVLRAHIVRAALGAGVFSWQDTRLTAACLAVFSLGLVFQGLQLLLSRALYAAGRNIDVFLSAILGGVITVAFAFFGMRFFGSSPIFASFLESLLRIEGLVSTKVIMLSIAFVLGALFSVIYLQFSIRKIGIEISGIFTTFFHSFASALAIGFVAYQFLDYFGGIFGTNTFVGIVTSGFLSGVLGLVGGAVLLYMLRNREFGEILNALRKKFSREEVIPVQEL